MSRPQSAPAVPAPQKWEFDKMPNQTGHVQKNRMYYRRGVTNSGCYWTDLYHTPQSRLKFVNYRPDLDQEHQKYVQSRKEVESQQYNAEIQRRIKRKQKIRRKFQARQGSNYKKAIPNTQLRAAPPSTQRSSKSKRPGRPKGNRVKPAYPVQKIIKKDQAYYRRRGNLWNDLAHTPRSRLHLVVTPEVIQGDALCVENMQKDADQKEKQHLYAVMAHEERVKELRSNLGIREAERVELENVVMQNVSSKITKSRRIVGNSKAFATKLRKPSLAAPKERFVRPSEPKGGYTLETKELV